LLSSDMNALSKPWEFGRTGNLPLTPERKRGVAAF
jgi:hypothetical protein